MTGTGHHFDPSILREYDIRGIVGETLSPADALALGRILGSITTARNGRVAVVGFDGRLTSPMLEEELCRGLAASGLYILRVGLVPTPGVYFATKILNAALGIMITGSHNPAQYNGFKIVLDGAPYYGADIQRLQDLAKRAAWTTGHGGVVEADCMSAYVEYLAGDYKSQRGLKVAWDAGNGAAGPAMLRVAQRLPGEHIMLNEKIDGTFPAHHPDPTVEANLAQLKQTVLEENCDLGVAFDGDGDRIGVIDDKGRVIWGDQLLAIYAREILAQQPGGAILADVKASQSLFDEISRLGGTPVMCPTGHSIIKTAMAEHSSPLAGEMSGHIFFADHYFGYDDAIYAAVRLISFLSKGDKKLSEIRDELPQMINTPEIRIDVPEVQKFAIVDAIKNRLAQSGDKVNDTDGVRVLQQEGWWLIRASNTQNALVVRCESDTQEGLQRLRQRVADELSRCQIDAGAVLAN